MGLKRAALLTLAACVAAAAPATASASELVARNASHVHLKVNRRGVALVQYVAGGGVGHVYYWGGRNRSLGFARDRSGGKGGYKRFRNACRPYDGPALFAMVAACKAPDGSYWALQSWMYHVPNYGGTRGARELRLSHWTGALARMWAAMDWSWHGRYHHLYGQLTYRGRGVVPGTRLLDRRGARPARSQRRRRHVQLRLRPRLAPGQRDARGRPERAVLPRHDAEGLLLAQDGALARAAVPRQRRGAVRDARPPDLRDGPGPLQRGDGRRRERRAAPADEGPQEQQLLPAD